MALWRSRLAKLDMDAVRFVLLCVLFSSFLGSRAFSLAAYAPAVLVADPLAVLRVWESMSSFGGLMGGLAGATVGMQLKRWSLVARLRFLDALAYAFTAAWLWGRLGCALVHDHVGVPSTHMLAVAFPGGGRWDLGLLEWLATMPIAAVMVWLGRRLHPAGLMATVFFLLYCPMRFGLDMLRADDARYLGWTPAQYCCVIAFALSLVATAWIVRRAKADPANRC